MDEQAVIQAYREGKKAVSIEAEYGLTPGRLYRLLRKHGVPLRTEHGVPPKEKPGIPKFRSLEEEREYWEARGPLAGVEAAVATPYRIPFRCESGAGEGVCGHEWEEEIFLPMQVDAFLARSRGWSVCPRCGGKKVYMLMKEPNPFYKKGWPDGPKERARLGKEV